MKKQFKIGVIGCNANAETVLRGVVLSDFIREKKIIVSDKNEEALDKLNYLGVKTTTDNSFVARNCEYLILSCSLKEFDEIAKNIEGIRPEKVISLIPSATKSAIKNALGIGLIKVARCVLNPACAIGSGLIGIDMNDFNKSTDDTDFITNIFGYTGTVVSVGEDKLDAISTIGGNIVFPLMFIDGMVGAGVKLGLTKNEAQIIAVQTLLGAAEMVQRGENSLDELLVQSCKNGNPAIEIVKVLQDGGLNKLIEGAAHACFKELNGRKL
ncbi:MAG: NAD(P)-binding domain-containing protein [Clostridia bacterium]|jgi:pyrroline-5-carboxylate reductase|nr:NAD(P)-binding domain-containing protein [Clostridia bacterium]